MRPIQSGQRQRATLSCVVWSVALEKMNLSGKVRADIDNNGPPNPIGGDEAREGGKRSTS